MSNPHLRHLSDAELSDLLAGESPAEHTRLHLDACDYCRGELETVQESLASFSGFSTRWANTSAPSRVPVPSRWALRLGGIPTWTTGLAATALTGLLVFNLGPIGRAPRHADAKPAVVIPPSNTELADDNRLMLSIDQELNYQERPALAAGAPRPATQRVEHRMPDAVIN